MRHQTGAVLRRCWPNNTAEQAQIVALPSKLATERA